MKNYCYLICFFISIFWIVACNETNAQKGDTPEAVKNSFQLKYPGENDPDWHTDRNGNYEANFKKKGVHYRADYSPNGQWIETENSIKEKELPDPIKKLLKDKYDDFKIIELEFVSHYKKGEFYDLEIKEKGKDKFDLEVKADGRVIGRE